jgi:hypothetical protein
MPPFGGNGVNEALTDAVELALRLASVQDWDRAVLGYEEDMFERVAPIAESAMEGLAFISEDGLGHSLRHAQELKRLEPADAPGGSETPSQILGGRLATTTRDASLQAKVKGAYRFDLSGPNGGTWVVDFRRERAGVREGDETADCTIAMSDKDFVSMAGRLGPRGVHGRAHQGARQHGARDEDRRRHPGGEGAWMSTTPWLTAASVLFAGLLAGTESAVRLGVRPKRSCLL